MPFDLNGNFIEFPIVKQQMSNWCWAACTVSVCSFYDRLSNVSQKKLAADLLHQPVCDSPRFFPACNKILDFGDSLSHVGHLNGQAVQSFLTPEQLDHSIGSGNPIGCQIDVPGIGGHAVLIVSGKKDGSGQLFLHVADPSDASILTIPYIQLRNNFRGLGGRWIRTYFIKP